MSIDLLQRVKIDFLLNPYSTCKVWIRILASYVIDIGILNIQFTLVLCRDPLILPSEEVHIIVF
ncbi:MAG: hypothetical protein QW690_02575, partial [Candidatus Anstonellales archaeon]